MGRASKNKNNTPEKDNDSTGEFLEEPGGKRDWRPHINYQWFVKNLPFLLFVSFLALLYIANGHFAVKNIREIGKLDQEVKELNWEFLNTKSNLMLKSKMSEISESVSPMGLKVPETAPLKIKEPDQK